jgi:hypothetical protein
MPRTAPSVPANLSTSLPTELALAASSTILSDGMPVKLALSERPGHAAIMERPTRYQSLSGPPRNQRDQLVGTLPAGNLPLFLAEAGVQRSGFAPVPIEKGEEPFFAAQGPPRKTSSPPRLGVRPDSKWDRTRLCRSVRQRARNGTFLSVRSPWRGQRSCASASCCAASPLCRGTHMHDHCP